MRARAADRALRPPRPPVAAMVGGEMGPAGVGDGRGAALSVGVVRGRRRRISSDITKIACCKSCTGVCGPPFRES
jgi:hypothetical protein